MSRRSTRTESTSDRTAVLSVLALLAVPWSIQVFPDRGETFLFAWGLLGTSPIGVTTLFEFLFVHTRGLPEYIFSWPLSVVCYGGAVASAVVGWRRGREDPRVTGGLLVVTRLRLVG